MFYVSEIYFRGIYSLFMLSFLVIICYIFADDFLFIFILPTIFSKSQSLTHFIAIEPQEIFYFYLYIIFFFIVACVIPFAIFNIFDYVKQSTYSHEWQRLKIFASYFFITNMLTSFLAWRFGLTFFWKFFLSLEGSSSFIPFYFEISSVNYLIYSIYFFFLLNVIQIIFVTIFFRLQKNGYKNIFIRKKYVYALFIIFSTIVTPPDILWQICLFFCLYICFEIFNFFFCVAGYYFKRAAN